MIAVLALFLSFSETLGKSAQTEAISANVESANLWSFFQAKTVRMTMVTTAAEEMKVDGSRRRRSGGQGRDGETDRGLAKDRRALRFGAGDARRPQGAIGARQGGAGKAATSPWRSIITTRSASAAFQIGIVLASAAVITGAVALAWLAGALGVAGLAILALGLFAPHLDSPSAVGGGTR